MSSIPTDAENRELIRRAQAGDAAAREECLTRNKGLAIGAARRYRLNWHDTQDLIQEAWSGLDTAIMRFDLAQDNKLCTYASHWIRQRISVWFTDKRSIIRVPKHLHAKHPEADPATLRAAQLAMLPVSSISVDEETNIGKTLESRPMTDLTPEQEELTQQATRILDQLPARERSILMDRYYDGLTLKEVGKRHGICAERVRVVQLLALRHARKVSERETA